MDANLQQEFTTAIAAIEKIRATLEARECQAEEAPSAILDDSASPLCTCDTCGIEIAGEEALFRIAEGLCYICAEHFEDSLKYYTEEFAHASAHGKDALRLLILRQRADNCRDTVAAAAGSYDGELEAHEASVEGKMLDERAAECLARLPPSFAPWWKDTWTHEKWCQIEWARETTGWALVSKDTPIVQRLAAMFLTEQATVRRLRSRHAEELQAVEERLQGEMKQKLEEMEAKHEEMLANIERARCEDMDAVEKRHQELRMQDNAKYAKCLAPLIDIRDKMRAECEKKCGEHDRRGYAMGYAFADQKWNPVYKAVCEELELVRKEGANHQAGYIRLIGERDELVLKEADLMRELDESAQANENLEAQIEALRMELASAKGSLEGTEVAARAVTASSTQVVEGLRKELTSTKTELIRAQDSATQLFQAMRGDLERLNAENKGLREQIEEDKQMVQRHLKEIAKENAEMTAWEKKEIERLREENKELQKKNAELLQLVNPTIKLMKSNPELFGGEALPQAVAPGEARGASSPRPPPIIRIKEEIKERALNFLRPLLAPSRACLLVESPTSALPGIVETEPSTEGMCMALTEEQYKEMFGADLLPPIVPDQAKVCGTAGCIDCPPLESAPVPVPVAAPVAAPVPVPVPETTHVCCVGCGKPKPNYNHPNWPSPITKRFAKHLAKHSGQTDPKTIKTHEDALEYIAKRGNISVETLLQWTMKHFQSFSQPWTLVEGPSKFNMGTAPATWWR
jgi:hypothetical protein